MSKEEVIKANNLITEEINTEKKLKKVCADARVSTDSEEQLTSYTSQIKYYTEKIKSNSDREFVGIYADEGITGTQTKNRCEFQRMIEDALNGKIDIIIAKSISRFARNTVDTLNNVRILREQNVDVFFEKENMHILKLDSEMFLTLYSAFAQAESESISQNVKMGLKSKRLSNLIDLKLDNIENKEVYNEKEQEINNKIKVLNSQIEQLEYNDRQSKDISKQLKNIEKIICEEEQPFEKFDDVKFENLVEKIIIGEKDINGNVNNNVIRFILKIGTEYKFKDLSFVSNKKIRNN